MTFHFSLLVVNSRVHSSYGKVVATPPACHADHSQLVSIILSF